MFRRQWLWKISYTDPIFKFGQSPELMSDNRIFKARSTPPPPRLSFSLSLSIALSLSFSLLILCGTMWFYSRRLSNFKQNMLFVFRRLKRGVTGPESYQLVNVVNKILSHVLRSYLKDHNINHCSPIPSKDMVWIQFTWYREMAVVLRW